MRVRRYSGVKRELAGVLLAALSGGAEAIEALCEDRAVDFTPWTPESGQGRKLVFVAPDTATAEATIGDLRLYLASALASGLNLCPFLPWEVLPFEALSPTTESSAERLFSLSKLLSSDSAIVVTTPEAMMQSILPLSVLDGSSFKISTEEAIARDDLVGRLQQAGYVRSSIVEECGQMAVRGAVVDFYPPGNHQAVRVEFFGDNVDSIRLFSPESQRSIELIKSWQILPVREFIFDEKASISNLANAVSRIRERASTLAVPERHVSPFIDALETGVSHPGIEQLYPLISENVGTFFDYLDDVDEFVVFDSPAIERSADEFEVLVESRAAHAEEEGVLFPEVSAAYVGTAELLEQLRSKATIYLDSLEMMPGGSVMGEHVRRLKLRENVDVAKEVQLGAARDLPVEPVASLLKRRVEQGLITAVVVAQRSRARRLQHLLEPYGISCEIVEDTFDRWLVDRSAEARPGSLSILIGTLARGFVVPQWRLALLSEAEIFPGVAGRRTRSKPTTSARRFLGSSAQLSENDYVVHIEQGVGIYRGLRQISVHGHLGDYLFLEYADQARLFVPVEDIAKVQKYVGAEGKKPALTKLGGVAWEKTKASVKEKVAELAGELINLYATREMAKGYNFGPLDLQDQEFADTFEYNETPDQQKAIDDVLKDMGRDQPMDRLVCGDVGYGKTEVALRAAFKAVNSGRQVALLVPTTVLADQHFSTFRERFSTYPINVACVSRFFSTKENKETLAKLASGKVDVIVGTHRILQRDVQFKDLGLVIIDEEHRFGVAHKEKLKRYRKEIDVLTLTATPIPRTLHMSMLNIRDLSVIETPPSDRQVVRTYIATYNNDTVREAIQRELKRSGQVFYIHNRVQNIGIVADELSELVPEARIEFAHGQMKDRELEEIMHRFVSHEIDVLVSTTIVESGIDIPNANTMIIRKADHFGLAELYQLRGRVGRSSRRAYAYMLISDPKKLGPDAKKRLEVLQSLDDLGVGFRLALQDMEIRGAGNLLGKDQSGQVAAVGFELYSRILKEAVQDLQAAAVAEDVEKPRYPSVDPEIGIGFPVHIPPAYVPDVGERLLLYQRLVALRNDEQLRQLADEIEDRFGGMPSEMDELLDIMGLRSFVRRIGVTTLNLKGNELSFSFHQDMPLEADRILEVVSSSGGALRLLPSMALKVVFGDEDKIDPSLLRKTLEKTVKSLGVEPLKEASPLFV